MSFKLEIRSEKHYYIFFLNNPIWENTQQAFVGVSLCSCVDRLIAICRMSGGSVPSGKPKVQGGTAKGSKMYSNTWNAPETQVIISI